MARNRFNSTVAMKSYLVDVVLHDLVEKEVSLAKTVRHEIGPTCCPDHRHGSGKEARRDLFQSREVQADVPEERVYLCTCQQVDL